MTTEAPEAAGNKLLGTLLDLRHDTLGTFLHARQRYGDVVRFPLGPAPLRTHMYGVFSADGVQQILASQAAVFRKENAVYGEMRTSIGNGLLTSQDTEYTVQRGLVQPVFARHRIDGYASAVRREAEATADRWATRPDTIVDINAEMGEFALRAISRILFGGDLNDAVDVVRRSFPVINEHILKRGLNPFRSPRSLPTPFNRRAAAAQRDLYAVCDRIIAKRHASPAVLDGDDAVDITTLLVDTRREDGSALDAQEVRDQVLVFLLAGHEPTATALTFALYLLARHPDVQQKAQAELDEILGGRAPEADDRDRLPYLTMVLKESMRIYPSVATLGRQAAVDTEIGGCRIPAGADVYISSYVTHRHPAYWDDPEAFAPERFTPEAEASRPRYAFFPFGGGPRACIGQRFAMLEASLALATLLQRYTLTAIDTTIPLDLGITMCPSGPVRVRLSPR